jgi:hypothetical protein
MGINIIIFHVTLVVMVGGSRLLGVVRYGWRELGLYYVIAAGSVCLTIKPRSPFSPLLP